WEIARRWIDGKATSAECWAAGSAARQRAEQLTGSEPRASFALASAASLAFACDERAEPVFWAQRGYVTEAAQHAASANDERSVAARWTADIVREHFGY